MKQKGKWEAYDIIKQANNIIAPKSKIESRAQYAPEPARVVALRYSSAQVTWSSG